MWGENVTVEHDLLWLLIVSRRLIQGESKTQTILYPP